MKEKSYFFKLSKYQDKLLELYKKHPYEQGKEIKNSERLNFCDVMDYNQIIQANWDIFNNDFGSKLETQKHFLNLKEYRNSFMHVRPMNSIVKKQGEASVEWISRIIGIELENDVLETEIEEDNNESEE